MAYKWSLQPSTFTDVTGFTATSPTEIAADRWFVLGSLGWNGRVHVLEIYSMLMYVFIYMYIYIWVVVSNIFYFQHEPF